MKHLIPFNESDSHTPDSIEKFFKNKIDWKFFNYILDRMTEFEDKGYGLILKVILHHPNRNQGYNRIYNNYIIYTHSNTDGELQTNYLQAGYTVREEIYALYRDGAILSYRIFIFEDGSIVNAELRDEIISKISPKSIIMDGDNDDIIMVKPK